MRLSWIKCWIAILCLALITGSLLGCSIITSNRTPVVDGVIDTSKYVKLSMYLIGPPSGDSTMDYQSIVEELNESIGDKMNTNVDITFIPYDETDMEYPLVFSSGTTFDIGYVSTDGDPSYFSLASKETLLAIDDLLPTYGKGLWEGMEPNRWEDTKYDGQIYAVPIDGEQYRINGFMFAGDTKYEPDEAILSIGDMENYLDTLAEENGKVVIDIGEEDAVGLYNMLVDLHKTWIPAPGIPESSLYLVNSTGDKTGSLMHPAFSREFLIFAEGMKKWADDGFWQEDVLVASKDIGYDQQTDGNVLLFGNFNRFRAMDSKLANSPDQGGRMLKFIPFCGEGKKIIKAGSAKNALGIGAGSKNPERAIMLIDYIVGSKYSDQILGYGYEGKIMDYSLFEDDPANHELLYIKDPYDKFVFDKTPVQNEIDNILLVNSQFGVPILLGRAGDPSTAVNRYRQELEAAGIHKVIDAVKEQLKDY